MNYYDGPAFLTNYLVFHAETRPSAVAIHDGTRRVTWKELQENVTYVAKTLRGRLGYGDQRIVALQLPNSVEFVVVYLAILYLKHVACPVDATLKPMAVRGMLDGIKPDVLITSREGLEDPSLAVCTELSYEELVADGAERLRYRTGDPGRFAATLLFTSGTTGKPKATLYSHEAHVWNVTTLSKIWKWNQDDTLLLSLPLSHWHGLVLGLGGFLYHGHTLYLRERFHIKESLELLSSGTVSLFYHVPPAYYRLVQYPEAAKYDVGKVRLFVSGSSYLPPEIWHKFKELFGQEILERYGSSEAGIIASNSLDSRIPGEVGKALPGVETKVLPDGQLAVRTPGRFMRYLRNRKATNAKVDADGWLHTGDMAEIRADGQIIIKGRVEERMKKSGYLVSPRDVEWELIQQPTVKDVFVLGRTTGGLDDEITAFVVLESGGTVEGVRKAAEEVMPRYWLPDRYIIMDEIPRTNSGKPRLRELKDRLEAEG